MHMGKTAVTLVALLAFGCGEKQDPGGGEVPDPSDGRKEDSGAVAAGSDAVVGDSDSPTTSMTLTYGDDVAPILQQNCTPCHSSQRSGADRNGAPLRINLDTYDGVVASREAANRRIQAGSMPPSGPLSDEEKAIFKSWLDDGFPE